MLTLHGKQTVDVIKTKGFGIVILDCSGGLNLITCILKIGEPFNAERKLKGQHLRRMDSIWL
jgi:hypothetical protein